MLFKFFSVQWKYPTNKQNWTEQVKGDLEDFEIPVDLELIKSKSEFAFKSLVKKNSKVYAWKKFMSEKMDHSKMENLWYPNLNLQGYLASTKFTTKETSTLFNFRTRMAKFEENYKNGRKNVLCPLCHLHYDTQSMAFQCQIISSEVSVIGKYEDIFKDDIPLEVAKTLIKIMDFRTKYLEERRIES